MHSARFDHNTRNLTLGAASLIALLLFPPDLLQAQDLLRLARQRHHRPDSTLHDYRAELHTLVSVGFITDPLAPPKLVIASELASGIAWQREGGLQIRMLGQRYVTSFGRDIEAGLDFSEPWFVATLPGDSLRVLGGIGLPERAAIHPFAPGAERYYTYALGDTLSLLTPGRQVDLVEVRVSPTRGDEALVVGSIWVDALTGDIGAMQIRFVGKPLWADDENPEGSAWANRILSVSATLEQGLWEQRYWLPHRQQLELMIRIPFIGNFALPLVFKNEFGRFDINSDEPIAWMSPDSLRTRSDSTGNGEHARATITISPEGEREEVEPGAEGVDLGIEYSDDTQVRAGTWGGGWEIIRPPDDSLLAYDEWDRPLETPASDLTLPSAEELERRARELSPSITGRKMFAIQYDRLPDLIRYNRVEALALGVAARWDIPRRAFWSLGGGFSFGIADLAPKARLDLRYDASRKRIDLAGYSELHLAGSALTDARRAFGSSMRAFFLGRDDADYYRSSGAALTGGQRWGRFRLDAGIGIEDQGSVERNTQIAIPGIWEDSVFQTNPPADEGTFWRGDLASTIYVGDWERPTNRAELTLGSEVGSGMGFDYVQPRIELEGKFDLGSFASVALVTRGGWTSGDAPAQRLWGIGGLETVRGYTYGTRLGDSFWTARIEIARRRPIFRPVVFADFGWAGDTGDWPSGGASGDVLWSAGVGASLLNGLFRADLVFPESGGVWLEFYFAGDL